MATRGCCRRSPRDWPAGSTPPRRRSRRRRTWRARCGVRRPPTASTSSAPGSATRTGRTGTPRTWWRSRPARNCRPDMSAEPELTGQTVVVIGGSAGIGFETARLARQEGADVIITGRDPDRLDRAGGELGARCEAFDATDFARLGEFFDELSMIDHVLVTGPGPYYAPLAEFDVEAARRDVDAHLLLPVEVARHAGPKVRPPGTLLFIGGTGGRRTAPGLTLIAALTAAQPAMIKNLALELAPVRVNVIAAGFVDTPLSARLLGDQLDERREQLRKTLPVGRVIGLADIAALAIHLMINTALRGGTFDIDGGQQLVER